MSLRARHHRFVLHLELDGLYDLAGSLDRLERSWIGDLLLGLAGVG